MQSLYELVGEYKIFEESFNNYCELVASGELPESALWDTLDSLSGAVEEKIDNVTCVHKQMMYEVAMIKEEVDRLNQRLKTKQNAANRLKDYIYTSMRTVGMDKLETPRNQLSFRKSEKVMIDDADQFVQWAQEYNPDLLTFKQPEPNKTEIKRILKSGQAIEGCRVEQCLNLQIR
jgi:hypothetical protein